MVDQDPLPSPPPIRAKTARFEWDGGTISGDLLYIRTQMPSFLIQLYSGLVVPDWCDEDYENPIQNVLSHMEADYDAWLENSSYASYWLSLDLSLQMCEHGAAVTRCPQCRQ